MKKVRSFLKYLLIGCILLLVVLAIVLYDRYGGGQEYPDISTEPKYGKADLELFFSYPEPIGNVAASVDTSGPSRVFFTVHPESWPENEKLLEIVNGEAVPYPNAQAQDELFNTILGVFCDRQNRLWTIDHGFHGLEEVKLTAFDLSTNQVVYEYVYPEKVAEKLSFFNDLTVTPDGRYVFVADVSFFGKNPSLIVYDTQNRQSRSLLDGHRSLSHQYYVPVTPNKKMRFLGGLVDLLTGIDGLDVSPDGQYIYYAAMGHSQLFRVPVAVCTDFNLNDVAISSAAELVATKPLSDGIRCDQKGRVYITDIENQGVYVVDPHSNEQYTLIKDERIRWADGLSLGADGYFYLADSDIPNQVLQSKRHMKAHAPYHIFRFRPLE